MVVASIILLEVGFLLMLSSAAVWFTRSTHSHKRAGLTMVGVTFLAILLFVPYLAALSSIAQLPLIVFEAGKWLIPGGALLVLHDAVIQWSLALFFIWLAITQKVEQRRADLRRQGGSSP